MPNQIDIEYQQNLPDALQVTKQAMAARLFELKRILSAMASESGDN